MLYTSVPLEQVYRPDKEPQGREDDEYMEIPIEHGTVMVKRDGKDYIVEKTVSTDFNDYLKGEYTPGSRVKAEFTKI